jgi:serine/threonine protein kinase
MLVIRNSSNQLVQIDNYRVQSQLAKSDFATLYHVKDLKLEKEYILKFFKKNMAAQA